MLFRQHRVMGVGCDEVRGATRSTRAQTSATVSASVSRARGRPQTQVVSTVRDGGEMPAFSVIVPSSAWFDAGWRHSYPCRGGPLLSQDNLSFRR